MALAEALHPSSGLLTKKVVERREGPEGEVRETHYAYEDRSDPSQDATSITACGG